MGAISNKLRVEFLRARNEKVVSLRAMAEAKKAAEERHSKNNETLEGIKNQDPLFVAYAWMNHLLHDLAEDISAMPQMGPFFDIIDKAKEEYWPAYPPMSPVTMSYFNQWSYFDLKYGQDKETIASVLFDLRDILRLPDEFALLLRTAMSSRMGIFEHRGYDGDKLLLWELVTKKEISAVCSSGYRGQEGELWFVRTLAAPTSEDSYHLCITTPYVLLSQSARDWIGFFERNLIRAGNEDFEKRLFEFMKYGPSGKRLYWHEYIMQAYANFEPGHIYLTGLPDVASSRPHVPSHRNKSGHVLLPKNELRT